MAALFSDQTKAPARGGHEAAPRPAVSFLDEPATEPPPLRVAEEAERCVGVKFDAELDVCELDERGRPGLTWSAQAKELSRSGLAFRSRRMCYLGRAILIAVHLIDDRPAPLCGRVVHCSYDGEGMYRVEIELAKVPSRPNITTWLAERRPR